VLYTISVFMQCVIYHYLPWSLDHYQDFVLVMYIVLLIYKFKWNV